VKNILVVDGAENCAYDIFQAEDEEFAILFPGEGQDIQFIEDIADDVAAAAALRTLWTRPADKKTIHGLHGILFFELCEKSRYYPNRRDSDLDLTGRVFRSANGDTL
jgi:hypothetical protein